MGFNFAFQSGVNASEMTALLNLNAIYSFVIGVFVFWETPKLIQIVGSCFVVGAIILLSSEQSETSTESHSKGKFLAISFAIFAGMMWFLNTAAVKHFNWEQKHYLAVSFTVHSGIIGSVMFFFLWICFDRSIFKFIDFFKSFLSGCSTGCGLICLWNAVSKGSLGATIVIANTSPVF